MIFNPQRLDIFANVVQIATFLEVLSEANNNDIVTELRKQNENYFKKIIKQNEEILGRLDNARKINQG